MLSLRNATKLAPQVRQMSVIYTKPLVRVSWAEKMVHAGIMTTAFCAVPAWVLYHLRAYRGLE